jgi:hypothetical protein
LEFLDNGLGHNHAYREAHLHGADQDEIVEWTVSAMTIMPGARLVAYRGIPGDWRDRSQSLR